MSPSFDFSYAEPAPNGVGRWVEGSVVEKEGGYKFTAHLMLRHSPSLWQQNRVWLEINRPFRAPEFAAYLRLVSSEYFETASSAIGLCETNGLDPASAAAIIEATAVRVDPWDHQCHLLLQDLALLGDQLEKVRKTERLNLAFAHLSNREWAASSPSRCASSARRSMKAKASPCPS